VKVVRQHPKNPNLLFVGMERGIYASWDRGSTWVSIRNDLPRVSVRGIKIQPEYNDLVIGTHGRGAFILDDIQPLVELADALQKDAHLFTMRRATDWEMWSRGSNLGQSTYQGENPEPGAYIHYYLSDAAAARVRGGVATEDGDGGNGNGSGTRARNGDGVTVRITDQNGALVKEFQDTAAAAGINRAVWDLRWTGPSNAPREPQGFGGGPRGPAAVPGTYTATIVAGDQELSTQFELRGDPNVKATQADYDARFTAAKRAVELESRLNDMVATMRDLNEQVNGMLSSIEGKGLPDSSAIREQARSAKNRLAALRNETQRPPDGMNYRDWPRLLEQLRFVSRGIMGAQSRPTEGQVEVLTQIEQATEQRASELGAIIDEEIAELNRLLEGQPKILTKWQRRAISMR
jgi:hypothetical protein